MGYTCAHGGFRISRHTPRQERAKRVCPGTAGNENTASGAGGRLKDFNATVTLSPFERRPDGWKGLKVSAQALKGERNETQVRNRLFAGISYDSERFSCMGTYYNADNSSTAGPSRGEGFSVHALVAPLEKWWGFVRFDHYNPNIHAGGFAHHRYLYGVGYLLTKGVRLSVDHQYLEQEARTALLQDESLIFVHSELKF
jgi:hypothetical protein